MLSHADDGMLPPLSHAGDGVTKAMLAVALSMTMPLGLYTAGNDPY
jgi:hypothetical protein